MKIALCLKGKVGNRKKYATGAQSLDFAKIGFMHWKKNLLDLNDVDVFFHNWNPEFEEELVDMYNPKSHKCEKQINFNNCPTTRHFACYSNSYSIMKSVDLMKEYSTKSNTKYDAVVLSRFDLALQVEVNFLTEKLDFDHFHYHGPSPIHKNLSKNHIHCSVNNGLCCDENSNDYELGDLFFVSNPQIMYKFSRIYNNLDNLLCRKASNHMVSSRHLKNIGHFDDRRTFLEQKCFNADEYTSKIDGDVPLVRWAYHPNGEYKK